MKLNTLVVALVVALVSVGVLAWFMATHWPTEQRTEKLMHPQDPHPIVMTLPLPDAPSTTDEVCGAFNMGLSPDQIIAGLQQNDGRYRYWQAQRATVWPIIEGECG